MAHAIIRLITYFACMLFCKFILELHREDIVLSSLVFAYLIDPLFKEVIDELEEEDKK